MKYSFALISCLIAGCLVFISNPVRAQLAPVTIKDGKVVMPLSYHDTIRLDTQELTVRGDEVEASFRLFNTGPTITQYVGVQPRNRFWDAPIECEGWVNGKKMAFSTAYWDRHARYYKYDRRGEAWWTKPLPEWMVAEVTFPSNALTTIRVRYELNWPIDFGYSRYWKGSIATATFIIDRTEEEGGDVQRPIRFPACPGPREITNNLERYELRDFKPARWAWIEYDHVWRRMDYRKKSESKQAQH
jgi:hypothetical protein